MVEGTDREIVCEACEQPFVYSQQEQSRDGQFGYPAPRVCPDCSRQRRAAGAAERAAKRPRRRNFRR